MADLDDLETDAQVAVTTSGFTVRAASTRLEQHVAASAKVASVQVVRSEEIVTNSNQTKTMAELLLLVIERAAGSTLAQIENAEDAVRGHLITFTTSAYWSALTAVAGSPLPEVETESEPERIGECVTFTLRVRVALEA